MTMPKAKLDIDAVSDAFFGAVDEFPPMSVEEANSFMKLLELLAAEDPEISDHDRLVAAGGTTTLRTMLRVAALGSNVPRTATLILMRTFSDLRHVLLESGGPDAAAAFDREWLAFMRVMARDMLAMARKKPETH